MALVDRIAAHRGRPTEQREATLAATLKVLEQGRSGSAVWAGVPVTPESAMSHPAVWRSVTLIAGLVASFPVDEVRKVGGLSVPVEPASPLLVAPSGEVSPKTWVSQAMQSGLLDGNAVGVVVARDGQMRPTQIELVNLATVQTRRDPRSGVREWRIDGRPVPSDDIWHAAWNVPPGGTFGRSLVEYARQQIGIGVAATQYAGRWFGEGAHPTQLVKVAADINQEQAKEIKQRVLEATRGNREPLVLGQTITDLSALQSSPADSELIQTWARNLTDVANFFGLPPELVGGEAGGSMTYANLEARGLDLLRYCVALWMAPLEEALTLALAPPRRARFNVDAVLRSDTSSRYTAHGSALRSGFRSVNEVRALEDLPPIDGGDEFLWPPYRAFPIEPDATPPGGKQ